MLNLSIFFSTIGSSHPIKDLLVPLKPDRTIIRKLSFEVDAFKKEDKMWDTVCSKLILII